MKITFNGHQQTERQTELSQEELHTLVVAMKMKFLDHIEFGKFDGYRHYDDATKMIMELCEAHNVDVAYTPDRLNFFTEVIKKIENPYE
jgi:pantothenate synthetase